MSARGIFNGLRSPVKVAESLIKYAPSIVQKTKERLVEKQRNAKNDVPLTRFNLETSPHRVFDSTAFDLADFRPLRGLVKGATINDLVLEYAQERYENTLAITKNYQVKVCARLCQLMYVLRKAAYKKPNNRATTSALCRHFCTPILLTQLNV